MNYFAYPTAAERYANGRPFFHPLAIEKIRSICCQGGRIDRVLDVGCGAGQSTLALLEFADQIIGVDNSAEMLAQAGPDPRVRYVNAQAEQMPFDDASVRLITVALAFHWFDRRRFMLEARRILQPGGWLVIYNDGFTGRMIGNDNFQAWHREHYLARYPTPPRNSHSLTDSEAREFAFDPSGSDEFVHEVEFMPEKLVNYLLTQTNVIAAVEAGTEDVQSVARWLLDSVQPLFINMAERFAFSCGIRFFRRA